MTGNNARLLRRLENHCTGTVAKQHTGITVRPVNQLGYTFGTHNQRTLRLARLDEFVGGTERIYKSGARGFQAECRASGNAKLVLNDG